KRKRDGGWPDRSDRVHAASAEHDRSDCVLPEVDSRRRAAARRSDMNAILQEKLNHLPTRPGVYQHKDASGKVLYVGKAKNLRHRVRSYFQEGRPKEGRLRVLLSKVEDVEVIVTDTEAEALILENNLI